MVASAPSPRSPAAADATAAPAGADAPSRCTAFAGARRIAAGTPHEVAAAIKAVADRDRAAAILVFDDATGRPVEFDLRGTLAEVVARVAAPDAAARGPGRPRLGVVAREVTLLPRHWEWLNSQPGGASVALRKLVEAARSASANDDRIRHAREAAHRFATAMAGNEPGYEESLRALYAGDRATFERLAARWPADIGTYAMRLATAAWGGSE
jgi:uncharacterized protein